MSGQDLDRWLYDLTTANIQGYVPCLAAHPKRRLLCDLPAFHDDGHACYPYHYKEPVSWRATNQQQGDMNGS